MIQVRVRKRFGTFTLDVDLTATTGVTVLFGPSGAGKTLTLNALAGFVRPDRGRIEIAGTILYDGDSGLCLPPRRRGCGYVFQHYALFPHQTLRQNLEFAIEHLPRLERHRRVNDLLDRFQLTPFAERRPAQVSGGQRQRCSIARALIGSPRVLLLDEPARGLDAPLRADLYRVIRQVRAEFGTPVVLVTHDLEECFAIGEQMVVLQEGQIVQTGTPANVLNHPGTAAVARLLGQHGLTPGEILLLDPQHGTSRLRIDGHTIDGRYYPGHLKGDQVTVCVRADQVVVHRTAPKTVAAVAVTVEARIPRPGGWRLEFRHGLRADVSGGDDWNQETYWLEIPPGAIHLLPPVRPPAMWPESREC